MSEAESQSYGAAIFSAPDTVRNISVTGAIENNLISNNVGMSVFDDDRFQGPSTTSGIMAISSLPQPLPPRFTEMLLRLLKR